MTSSLARVWAYVIVVMQNELIFCRVPMLNWKLLKNCKGWSNKLLLVLIGLGIITTLIGAILPAFSEIRNYREIQENVLDIQGRPAAKLKARFHTLIARRTERKGQGISKLCNIMQIYAQICRYILPLQFHRNIFAPDRACGGRCLVLEMEISAHVVRCPGHEYWIFSPRDALFGWDSQV